MRAPRLIRVAAVLVAGAAILIVVAFIVVRTPWASDQARRLLIDRANDALAAELHVDQISGSLLGHATLAGVTITLEGQPVIQAERLVAHYSPWRLWRSGLEFDEIELVNPHVRLVQDSQGWNVARLLEPRSPDDPRNPVDFSIDRLRLTGGVVDVTPHDARTRHLGAVELDSRLVYEDGDLLLSVGSGAARDLDTGVAIRSLQADVSVDDEGVHFADLRLESGGSLVTGDVHLPKGRPFTRLTFDASARPVLLTELSPYVPALARWPQSAVFTVDARGDDGEIHATWNADSDAGGAAGVTDVGLHEQAISLKGDVTTRAIDLARWLDAPRLASRLTAAATYSATVPRGAVPDTDVTFTGTAASVDMLGYQASRVRAQGRYNGGHLDTAIDGSAYDATFDGRVTWTRATGGTTVSGRYAGVDLRALPDRLKVPELDSDLAGTAVVEGGSDGWRTATTLDASTVAGARIAAGATAALDFTEERVAYTFHGDVAGLDPARFAAVAPDAAARFGTFAGVVNGRFDVQAEGRDLETLAGRFDATLAPSTMAGVNLASAVAHAAIDAHVLTATLQAAVRDVTDATLGLSSDVAFTTSGTATATLRWPDVRTPFDLGDVTGDAHLELGPSSVQGNEFDAASADLALAGGLATVRRLVVDGPAGHVEAQGSLAIDGAGRSDLTYTARLGDLGTLERVIGRPITGAASAEGRITGPANRLQAVGTFTSSGVGVANVAAQLIDGTYDLVLPDRDWARLAGSFTANASLVEVASRPLARAGASVTFAEGRYEVDATASEGPRTLAATGVFVPEADRHAVLIRQLALGTGTQTWRLPDGAEARVEYAAERLDVRGLSLVNGDATIRVEGTLGDPETPLAATLEQVGIETLNDLLPEGRTMAGRLDGVVRVAGPFDALRYDARAHVVAGEVDGLKFDSIGGDVSLDRRRLGLDVRLEAGTLGTFAAVGTMPLSFGEPSDAAAPPYDLTVTSSELNLGFFQPLTTEIANITGTSRMNIRVLGPAEQPELSGTVNVAGAAFDVVPTGVSYTQLNADFTVKGQQVIVERLTLQDTDGHVATVQGELNVPRLGPPSGFELRITADEVHVLENAYGEVALSADIQAMGDLETPLLSGTISVDRAVIEASDLLDRLSARGYQRAPVSEGDNPELGSYDRASVSITLALPDNVIVRGRDLRSGSGPLGLGDVNVTIGGALTIAKETGGRPTLEGRVDVVRGSYQFQGRRFEIQRGGELRFLRSLTNPTLDVDAEREISGVTANVHLGGTLERPELVLTSTPALDQGDILALVVFGQTMNTLPSSQRVSLAARAGVIAAGAIATPLSDSVARALDLDQFEIRPAESATGASVIVGRQVNERLFVGFEQEFGSDEASQVNFEYRVNEFLRIVTSFAQGGTNSLRSRRAEAAGIDLIFVIR